MVAVAPTLSINDIASIREDQTATFEATITGGSYTDIAYSWSVQAGGGSFDQTTSARAVYSPANVAVDTTVTIRCTVSVDDSGDGTSASTLAEETFFIIPIGQSSRVVARGRRVTYIPPEVTSDTPVSIRVVARVKGTGERVLMGSEAVSDPAIESFTVRNQLRPLVVPGLAIVPELTEILETASPTFRVNATGGDYDEISYEWSVVSGGGSFNSTSGEQVTYTPANVPVHTTVTIRCTATVIGNNENVTRGSLTVSASESFTVNDHIDAMVPDLAITDITSIREDATVTLTVTPTGGVYDELDYVWSVASGGGTLNTMTGDEVVYTPADVSTNTEVTIRCVATARGTGSLADDGSSESATIEEVFTVTTFDAVAPSLAITDIRSIVENVTPTLVATPTGGRYDTIDYEWSIVSGSGSLNTMTGDTVVYTPDDLSTDISVEIRCVATVKGTGTLAENGTSANVTATETFAVTTYDAIAPTLAISDIPSIREDLSVLLRANLDGGRYDNAQFEWVVVSGGGTFSTQIGNTVVYNPPNVSASTTVQVRCTVTVRGTGFIADDGTSAMVSATESFTVVDDTTAINAIAPFAAVNDIQSISANNVATLTIDLEGGVYDIVSYSWSIVSGSGAFDRTDLEKAVYTPHEDDIGGTVEVRCIVTVTGDGTNAVLNSTAQAQVDESFMVVTANDIVLGAGNWQGGAIAGDTVWIVEKTTSTINSDGGVARAFSVAEETFGERDATKDIDLGNSGRFSGAATDGTTIWFPNRDNDELVAYTIATRALDISKTIALETNGGISSGIDPQGATTDGTTLWVVDRVRRGSIVARAFVLATGARDADKDVTAPVSLYSGITYADGLLYLLGSRSAEGGINDSHTAYAVHTSTLERVSNRDIVLDIAERNSWSGLFARDDTVWAIQDSPDNIAFAYTIPPLAGAVAPTLDITNITDVLETGTVALTATPSDGAYDTIAYTWSIVSGGGALDTTTGDKVVYTPTNVADHTDVTIRCEALVRGEGTLAVAGSSDRVSGEETFQVLDHVDAEAPILGITPVGSIRENETVDIVATPFGGIYDTIVYAWSVVSGGGTFNVSTGDEVTYTPADVSTNTEVTIRCVATVAGTGNVADDGTSDMVTAEEVFTVRAFIDATAPSLSITDIDELLETGTATFSVTSTGGTYDTIDYAWSVHSGGGAVDKSSGTNVDVPLRDTELGEATQVGSATNFGVGETSAMGLTEHGGVLYMVGTTNKVLYTLNAITGVATRVGSATQFGLEGFFFPSALASHNGTLYMMGLNDVLYTLNTTTGEATIAATITGSITPDGIASHGGVLYLLDERALYILNPATGAITQVGSSTTFGVNETDANGLTSHEGVLYMVGASTDALYTLDTTTGVATRVGSVSQFGVSEKLPAGLASHDDALYMIGSNNLYTIETTEIPIVVVNQVVYTPTNVASHTDVTLRCVATVRGTGTEAVNMTSDTVTADETFRVLDHIDAVAPTLELTRITRLDDRDKATLTATISGGTYDTISYAWSIVSGGGSLDTMTGEEVVYTPADVSVDTEVTIRCVVTARGTGSLADDGSSDTVTVDEMLTVFNYNGVPTPTTRRSGRDISLGSSYFSATSDFTTIWFNGGVAYDAATRTRNSSRDFSVPSGVIFNTDSTLWAVDGVDDMDAYNLSDLSRDRTKDFDPGTVTYNGASHIFGSIAGGAYDGTTLWIVGLLAASSGTPTANRIRIALAFTPALVRDASKDIVLPDNDGADFYRGATSDGITLWFLTPDKAIAYNAATRARDATKDITGLSSARFIVTDEQNIWIGVGTNALAYGTPEPQNTQAPSLTVTDISSIIENQTATLSVTPEGGIYDSISYEWSIVSGGGALDTTTGTEVVYTPDDVAVDTDVQIRCIVTAVGEGFVGIEGTSDTATVNEDFKVISIKDAAAPTLTVTDIDTISKIQTATLTAVPTGGVYDSIAYAWSIRLGGGALDTMTGTEVVYTPADVSINTQVTIRCVATVMGTGATSTNMTSDTVTVDETFTIDARPPEFEAPTLAISPNPGSTQGHLSQNFDPITFTVTAMGGHYDEIEYSWDDSITFVNRKGSFTPSDEAETVYRVPDGVPDGVRMVTCTVIVRATGTMARATDDGVSQATLEVSARVNVQT